MSMQPRNLVLALALSIGMGFPGAVMAQVQPSDPGLKPGDLVDVTVWQRDELSGQFTVAQDGTLLHPLYRQVRVTGLAPAEIEQRLRSFLSEYEANPLIVVQPLFQVSVAGQVMRPDIYSLVAGTTVSQAVIQAGGVTESGKMDDVQITRGPRTFEVDLREASTIQMPVQSGDQILVRAKGSVGAFRQTILPLIQIGLLVANIATNRTR